MLKSLNNLHFCISPSLGCTTWNICPNLSLCLLRWTPCGFHSDPIWREANKSNIPHFKVINFGIFFSSQMWLDYKLVNFDTRYVLSVIVRETVWLRSSSTFLKFYSAQCNNVTAVALNRCFIINATQYNSCNKRNKETNKEYSWSYKSKKSMIEKSNKDL